MLEDSTTKALGKKVIEVVVVVVVAVAVVVVVKLVVAVLVTITYTRTPCSGQPVNLLFRTLNETP